MNKVLDALIDEAKRLPPMTEAQIAEQRASWVRGMTKGCEHGVLDFEQCEKCRAET